MAQIEVTLKEAQPLIMDAFRAGLTPAMVSSPGIGKSDLARQICKKQNLKLIDIRLSMYDPADLNGFPFILNKDAPIEHIKAGFVPIEVWPVEGDELPINPETGQQYNGWMILLDEFNSAPLSVQAAAYKLTLDRMVGMHRLHSRCVVLAAGNKMTDKAIVQRTGTAQQSRMNWLTIKCCPIAWLEWAEAEELDHRVCSMIRFKEDLLHKFDPNHTDLTFPCPRTWHFTSRIIKPWKDIIVQKLALLAGTVGDGAAREFYSFSKIYGKIPTLKEIIANPQGCRLGDEPSMQFALSGMVSRHLDKNNAQPLVSFLDRLGIDFQVVALRNAIKRTPAIRMLPEVKLWLSTNSRELVAND